MNTDNAVRIYKYPLPTVPGKFTIKFDPPNCNRLWFAEQRGYPVIYAEVGEHGSIKELPMVALMTGQGMDKSECEVNEYLGTAMLGGGNFVLHYYLDWVRYQDEFMTQEGDANDR